MTLTPFSRFFPSHDKRQSPAGDTHTLCGCAADQSLEAAPPRAMTEQPNASAPYKSLFQILRGVEVCLEHKLHLPALVLIYSVIDAVGWLGAEPEVGVRESFTRWAERYLVQPRRVPCTALELYAARCGILHTLTSDSRIAKKGDVRQIAYSWGNRVAADLQRAIDVVSPSEYVAVQVEGLAEAVRLGVADFFDDVDAEPQLSKQVQEKASRFFVSIEPELVKALTR